MWWRSNALHWTVLPTKGVKEMQVRLKLNVDQITAAILLLDKQERRELKRV